ncbi:putative phospholipase B-like lamina ancestor [Venturia canescens]|uniref:putative phospholipase B-like lamina ancestor n=1 Tax=Venturia canescens TaxID=32260 RepID=UPI001C9CE24D|nr:putative phospholipase B-like lamina ancestor [Venturia canescens]XP_043274297.1 putative phospholipase B-like lamina ancestor [Venturia canescens]
MLKVVGASWLQTRISTYILVAVGLLGIGAVLIGEFGRDQKDGTYSATVFWNPKGRYYRIDFWGQGNNLVSVSKGAARAYYKTRIHETGWSIIEIETSSSYPDSVQAYAAGFLEGSLTWQLIHHHWHNTIGNVCSLEENEQQCFVTRKELRENAAVVRERAKLLASEDPFWHMVHLFYAQLDGMEAGWLFAVRRSRRPVHIEPEDFLWLAMASEIPNELFTIPSNNKSSGLSEEREMSSSASNNGVIFVKSLDRSINGLDPLITFAQNTVAPYSKMLRLLKRYTFGYHLSGSKHSPRAPTRSISMSSYPGALSSHDEYYVVQGGRDKDETFILASLPLQNSLITNISASSKPSDSDVQEKNKDNDQEEVKISNIQGVMSPVRIMSANRLATETESWLRFLARGNLSDETKSSTANLQWVTLTPNDSSIWLVEQQSSTIRAFDLTNDFLKNGFVFCNGESIMKTGLPEERHKNNSNSNNSSFMPGLRHHSDADVNNFFSENVTSVDAIRNLMRGSDATYFDNDFNENRKNTSLTNPNSDEKHEPPFENFYSLSTKFIFRGDLEMPSKPIGTIDNKMILVTANSVESFEASCGPPFGYETGGSRVEPFDWSKSFYNLSRIGQPNKFQFESVIPKWVWF